MSMTFFTKTRTVLPIICLALFFVFFTGSQANLAFMENKIYARDIDTVLKSGQKLNVIATTFPIYIFTKNIVAGRDYINVDLLIKSQGGCSHDYAPTPADMARLSKADVIVMHGLGMDVNIEKTLKNSAPDARAICASDEITAMPHASKENLVVHAGHNDNPHVHAAPSHAAEMVARLAEGFASMDPDGAPAYRRAAEQYAAKLLSSARLLRSIGANTQNRGIVLQQSSLVCLAKAAGLDVVAVVEDHEGQLPSPSSLMNTVAKIKARNAVAIACESGLTDKPAKAVALETGLPVIKLDSMSSGPANAPLSYYETIMARNCQSLGQYFGNN